MFQNLTGWHALIILAIVVLVFGAAKLPALARSVGQSMRILRSESQTTDAAARPAETAATTAADVLAERTDSAASAQTADAAAARPKLAVAE